MFDLFPHVGIILALAVITILIARKFPSISGKNIEHALNEVREKKEEKKAQNRTFSQVSKLINKKKEKGEKVKVDPEHKVRELEKQKAMETKVQMHQNVLKVIDRITSLFKKGYAFLRTRLKALILLVRTKKAEIARKRKTDQEVVSEKTVDLLQKAARNFGSGEYKGAEKDYIEVIKIDPKNVQAYKGLGDVYEKQKNFRDAISSYQEVLRKDPLDNEASRRLLELRRKEREKA